MIVLDTSGLLAALDSSQRLHGPCAEILRRTAGPLFLSPFVLAELDYLLLTRIGSEAEAALLGEVARGVFRLETFQPPDVAQALEVIHRYGDLALGLTDASLVVLADRYRTRDILTLDHRHFAALRDRAGQSFHLLPRT